MEEKATRRDIDVAVGMFLAYQLIKEARDAGKTPVDVLTMLVGLGEEQVSMLLDIADDHADSQLQAVEEVRGRVNYNVTEDFHNHAVKQSIVMAAISEGNLALESKTFGDLDLSNPPEDMDEKLRIVTNGLAPGMVAMMAGVIVDDSYPNELPAKDILIALWIEGFTVSMLSEVMLEEAKDDPKIKQIYVTAEKLFGNLD